MKRNILALVVLSLFISIMQGCNTKESVDLKMVAEKYSQAVNKHDANAIASFYSENAIIYLSGEKEPIKGREAIIKTNQSMFRAFPDLNTDFLNIFTSEGYFIAEGITSGSFLLILRSFP